MHCAFPAAQAETIPRHDQLQPLVTGGGGRTWGRLGLNDVQMATNDVRRIHVLRKPVQCENIAPYVHVRLVRGHTLTANGFTSSKSFLIV